MRIFQKGEEVFETRGKAAFPRGECALTQFFERLAWSHPILRQAMNLLASAWNPTI
jgi:hypothetical protein